MPATYGEGRESALERLQAEVEGAGRAPSIIPFARNKSFTGRELQLAKLEAKLFSNTQTTSTLAIVGPGGTGKSQLALEVAHRTLKKHKHCSVFWIDASDKDSLDQSYTSIAQKLGVPGCDGDQADIEQIVKRCIAKLSTQQCLLIFDNVEGTTVQYSGSSTAEATDLADFLPHSKLCSVIFTTTESDTAKTLAPQDVVALRELTSDTALRMLQSRLTTPLSNAEQPGAIGLLRELSHLPLAVSQAAACMNASNMTVQQYQAQLTCIPSWRDSLCAGTVQSERLNHRLLLKICDLIGRSRHTGSPVTKGWTLHEHNQAAPKHSNNLCEDEQGESSLRKAVAATLSLSIGQVRRSNAIAVEQLYVAACVDRKDIPLDLLEAASPQARVDAIMILDRYALVIRRPAKSAFDVH
ncbi:AAA superfamily ATPase [Pyrenophora tritici-repentis]|nr:AAA superfamily ATPase [Pyrenophora tritici-repentis]